MSLFRRMDFVMHSGGRAQYKIECDELTDEDIETLAFIISQKAKVITGEDRTGIRQVHGIPRGGERLAAALSRNYIDKWGSLRLIVDDVLTTGRSMEDARLNLGWSDAVGVVIFARHTPANWIKPIFSMNWFNTEDKF